MVTNYEYIISSINKLYKNLERCTKDIKQNNIILSWLSNTEISLKENMSSILLEIKENLGLPIYDSLKEQLKKIDNYTLEDFLKDFTTQSIYHNLKLEEDKIYLDPEGILSIYYCIELFNSNKKLNKKYKINIEKILKATTKDTIYDKIERYLESALFYLTEPKFLEEVSKIFSNYIYVTNDLQKAILVKKNILSSYKKIFKSKDIYEIYKFETKKLEKNLNNVINRYLNPTKSLDIVINKEMGIAPNIYIKVSNFKIPNITYNDIGGYSELKNIFKKIDLDSIQSYPIIGLQGPSGVGKSMLLYAKLRELINKYNNILIARVTPSAFDNISESLIEDLKEYYEIFLKKNNNYEDVKIIFVLEEIEYNISNNTDNILRTLEKIDSLLKENNSYLFYTTNYLNKIPERLIRRLGICYTMDYPNMEDKREIIELLNIKYNIKMPKKCEDVIFSETFTGAQIEEIYKKVSILNKNINDKDWELAIHSVISLRKEGGYKKREKENINCYDPSYL